jgi:hypothetical protein
MQEFLRKPLSRAPETVTAQRKIAELTTLQVRDAFFAITSIENDQPKMVGGFRFKGEREEVEQVIANWSDHDRSSPAAETVDYERHRIEVVREGSLTVAKVYVKEWFFAANDVAALKALLDRSDRRALDTASTLSGEENFNAAFRKIPAPYAFFAYGRLDQYMARLAAKMPSNAQADEQMAKFRQIKSIAGATTFEGGKIRDVLFVTMPKMQETPDLTRSSLTLATAESFLYGAGFVQWPQLDVPASSQSTGSGLPAIMQRLAGSVSGAGITRETWDAAFGSEFGMVGDWPAVSRLPALLVTLPVKDAEKANQIVSALTSEAGGESTWVASEADGVRYYAQPPANLMLPIAPTLGITNKLAVLGLDRSSVDAAIKRSNGASALVRADNYKGVEDAVPTPKTAFWYLDTALLYARLDATLRPMLIMGAAFVPAIAQAVDLSKVPTADIVMRHLSPIVVSQSYDGNGYRTESVGPVSIYQAAIGIAVATGAGTRFYQQQMRGAAASGLPDDEPDDTDPSTRPTVLPSATPEPSPEP